MRYHKIIFSIILSTIFALFLFYTPNIVLAGIQGGEDDYAQFGVNDYRNNYKHLPPELDTDAYVFEEQFHLTTAKLKNIMSGRVIKLHTISGHTLNVNIDNAQELYFGALTQSPIIYNQVIYANFGLRYGGEIYSGIVPVRVYKMSTNDNYYFHVETADNTIHAFETYKHYYTNGAYRPVATPAISDNGIMFYPLSQWMITYKITEDNKLQYLNAIQRVISNIGTNEHSIGGSPLIVGDYAYFGSWNGRVWRVNVNNLQYKEINLRSFDIKSEHTWFRNRIRVASNFVLAENGNTQRVMWGVSYMDHIRNEVGGVCSADLALEDIRCTFGDRYYRYDSSGNALGSSPVPNGASINGIVDNGGTWSSRHKLLFTHDRIGSFYALDIYANIRFQDRSFRRSISYGSVSLDEEEKYAYFKANNSRLSSGAYAGSGYHSVFNQGGRVARVDAEKIAQQVQNSSGVVKTEQFRYSNIAAANELNGTYIYSVKGWTTSSEITGNQNIVGRTIILSTSGNDIFGSNAFGANIWYNENEKVSDVSIRKNATEGNPGRIDLFKNTPSKDLLKTYEMGKFTSPIAGINWHRNFDKGMMVQGGKGLMLLYLQNADLIITDLSVEPEADGKFYQSKMPDGETNIYKGHIRAITDTEKKVKVTKEQYENGSIVVNVYHTTNPIAANSKNIYECTTRFGMQPCEFTETPNYDLYSRQNLLNNSAASADYSKKYRLLYTKEIPIKDFHPVVPVFTDQGDPNDPNTEIDYYELPSGATIIDDEFDVFLHSWSNPLKEQKHHIIAYIDIKNNVRETDELNNLGYIMIKYEGQPKPDLDLLCAVDYPSNGKYEKNTTYTGRLLISNVALKHDAIAYHGFDYVQKQDGTVVRTGMVPKSSFPDGNKLKPGDLIEVPFTFMFTTDGIHELEFEINTAQDNGNVPETTYINNLCNIEIPVNVPKAPDLIVHSIGTTDNIYTFKFDSAGNVLEGQDIHIRGISKNNGEKDIHDIHKNKIVLKKSGTVKLFAFADCEPIMQAKQTCSMDLKLPKSMVEKGNYYVWMKADYGSIDSDFGVIVNEKSENNNVKDNSFVVQDAPPLPPEGTFTPNGGGITDFAGYKMTYSDLSINDYTINYTIGIFRTDLPNAPLVKTLASKSTGWRYPHPGDNPHFVPPQSSYQSNYFDTQDSVADWNALPKEDGAYQWDGYADGYSRPHDSTLPNGKYSVGIRYTYEITNPSHNDWLVPNGCSYRHKDHRHYYDCWKHVYHWPNCYYLSNSYYTVTQYGNTFYLDTTLDMTNVDITPSKVKAGEHIYISDKLLTRLEADKVTVIFPKDLIVTKYLKNTTWKEVGEEIHIELIPTWGLPYDIDDPRCYSLNDPYCNYWTLAENDAIIINPYAKNGEYEVTFRAVTKWDTPHSPEIRKVKIRVGDAIYNHIRIEEQNNGTVNEENDKFIKPDRE